jgi:chemotaxis regulatin CheY-phosphate phosphatase CheZ
MRIALAAVALVALTVGTATAYGASTRADYVAQVDPICKAGLDQETAAAGPVVKKLKRLERHAKQSHSRKVRRRVEKRETRLLARFYDFVAGVEQGVTAQIATIPPAVEDTSLVQVWLRARGEQAVATQRLFRSLAKGDFLGTFTLLFEVEAKSEEVTDLVRDFGFQYCSSPDQEVIF